MNETKVCSKCNRELPLSMFTKEKHGKYGLKSICKDCATILVKKWYEKNLEHARSYQRKYRAEKKARLNTLAKRDKEKRCKSFKTDVLGGYKIYILNYPRKKEKKYNVVSTAGDVFKTDKKEEFLQFIVEQVV